MMRVCNFSMDVGMDAWLIQYALAQGVSVGLAMGRLLADWRTLAQVGEVDPMEQRRVRRAGQVRTRTLQLPADLAHWIAEQAARGKARGNRGIYCSTQADIVNSALAWLAADYEHAKTEVI